MILRVELTGEIIMINLDHVYEIQIDQKRKNVQFNYAIQYGDFPVGMSGEVYPAFRKITEAEIGEKAFGFLLDVLENRAFWGERK